MKPKSDTATKLYIGFDFHKEKTAIALAEPGAGGEIRSYGEVASACNISSVKARSASIPAIWPMERSGIGQIAGCRRPPGSESGLAGARPWLDNGGVKI